MRNLRAITLCMGVADSRNGKEISPAVEVDHSIAEITDDGASVL